MLRITFQIVVSGNSGTGSFGEENHVGLSIGNGKVGLNSTKDVCQWIFARLLKKY